MQHAQAQRDHRLRQVWVPGDVAAPGIERHRDQQLSSERHVFMHQQISAPMMTARAAASKRAPCRRMMRAAWGSRPLAPNVIALPRPESRQEGKSHETAAIHDAARRRSRVAARGARAVRACAGSPSTSSTTATSRRAAIAPLNARRSAKQYWSGCYGGCWTGYCLSLLERVRVHEERQRKRLSITAAARCPPACSRA